MKRIEMTYDQVRQALSFIPSDEREVWVNVGNALKSEFSDAFDLFDDWSANAGNYDLKAVKSAWRSFKRGVVPIGYIIKLARQYGYVPERAEYQTPSPQLLAEQKAKRISVQLIEQAAYELAAKNAIEYSNKMWDSASQVGISPYLAKKCVVSESVRFLNDGSILVPMLDYSKNPSSFIGIQTIKPDGTKLFPKGVAKSGSACRLGEISERLLMICEGYATGLSIRMATSHVLAVFVAFDAGNLIKIVALLREKYPKHVLLICADNDQKTKGNPGIAAAKKALKTVGNAAVIYPIFPVNDVKSSDFNDLHVTRGLDAVKQQLGHAIRYYIPTVKAA